MHEITLTAENFEQEVLKSDIPVLIDFWAPWCGPCRMLAPTVAEIAAGQAGKLKVCKVNVDDEAELAANFRVSSIPLLVLMKDGKVEKTALGFRPREEILAWLQEG